jgi:hypothetical protein
MEVFVALASQYPPRCESGLSGWVWGWGVTTHVHGAYGFVEELVAIVVLFCLWGVEIGIEAYRDTKKSLRCSICSVNTSTLLYENLHSLLELSICLRSLSLRLVHFRTVRLQKRKQLKIFSP